MADVVSMPKLGFDMAEGTLVRWVKLEGETVNKGDILAEIETDKATVEVESSFAGVVHKHLVEQGSVVPVGTPIAIIAAPGEQVEDIPTTQPAQEVPAQAQTPQTAPAAPVQPAATPTAPAGPVKASPLARRMATEQGLDIHTLRGSGPGGRIVKRDVESALKSIPASFPLKPATPPAQMISTAIQGDETVPVDRLRAAIGRRMVESKQQVPHFYVTHACRVDELMSLRKKINSTLPEGEKISVNDFIIKAAGLALRRYPNLNASLNGDVILRHGDVNVGVAVAVPGGLLTVVNRNTDQKPLRVISREVREMVTRARDGKVRPDDIEGSTFSISNLGMFDVDSFVAIINPPEAAILAVGSVQEVPVVEDGQIKPGMVLKITLSADHRITDGAEAAQFLQAMAEYLENPLLMLI
ncbi:MAG TPA: dihydrolipoamide acetyltransferase family protein [Anaerolineaceae bacterium]|nr:dihydrolipoamide acetyltransferase family protein [Anaerolineaceae bacterium]HQF44914.1 dihydrolipoamide acetyltransferase family protein [Anaerolineaceae bacterium]HQH34682.1 dihydrolipoamide acetyltransferase family protein [Anaerolineaceae bacterium]HQJ02336.1 dihydrolipoamide acetyltransferase family protein [Anaerolineaceae bacterium]